MEESTNYRLLVWGLSIIQPASPHEVLNYLNIVLKDDGFLPNKEKVEYYFESLYQIGYIQQVSKRNNLYSITPRGNERLSPALKKLRDKVRIFFLDKCHSVSKLKGLASAVTENMGGVSPSLQLRHVLKEVPHPSLPWASGTLPSRPRQAWVRIYEQLNIGLKLSSEASIFKENNTQYNHNISDDSKVGSTGFSLNYYSFNRLDDVVLGDDGVVTIATCIGISHGLLTAMMKSPERYYRSFELHKKNGKKRQILAPRKFIKVVQYWINDHILNRLKIHSSCYSYRVGTSIKDNAINHVGRKFVANIDIYNYFGEINKKMIEECLLRNSVPEKIVSTISGLVTYHGDLPQGAPTSPNISNAILFEFDEEMSDLALRMDCVYTRYSDDITISGNDKCNVITLMNISEKLLVEKGFSLNQEKKRIASNNNRQVVTGILVNDSIRPTRSYRRKIRSAFDHAFKNMDTSQETIYKLKGYLNYLKSFEKYDFNFNDKYYNDILVYLLVSKGK